MQIFEHQRTDVLKEMQCIVGRHVKFILNSVINKLGCKLLQQIELSK